MIKSMIAEWISRTGFGYGFWNDWIERDGRDGTATE